MVVYVLAGGALKGQLKGLACFRFLVGGRSDVDSHRSPCLGRQKGSNRLLYDPGSNHGVSFGDGMLLNRLHRYPTGHLGHLVHPLTCLEGPADGFLCLILDRWTELGFHHQDVARSQSQQVFRIAPDVHVLAAVNARPSQYQQPGRILMDVCQYGFPGFSIKQACLQFNSFVLGDASCNVEMGLVDFCQSSVDDLFMQFLLFLKFKHLTGLVRKDLVEGLEHPVMEIGIKC